MYSRFYVGSLFFGRRQRTFGGKTLSSKPFGVDPGRRCGGGVELGSRPFDHGRCFQPLRICKGLVLVVRQPSDYGRLLRKSQRTSKSTLEVHV
jgi:hypothetical protein